MSENQTIEFFSNHFIKSPPSFIKKFIKKNPEWMFITGVLMVGGGLFIKAQDVKNENKALLDKIIKESKKIRESREQAIL